MTRLERQLEFEFLRKEKEEEREWKRNEAISFWIPAILGSIAIIWSAYNFDPNKNPYLYECKTEIQSSYQLYSPPSKYP